MVSHSIGGRLDRQAARLQRLELGRRQQRLSERRAVRRVLERQDQRAAALLRRHRAARRRARGQGVAPPVRRARPDRADRPGQHRRAGRRRVRAQRHRHELVGRRGRLRQAPARPEALRGRSAATTSTRRSPQGNGMTASAIFWPVEVGRRGHGHARRTSRSTTPRCGSSTATTRPPTTRSSAATSTTDPMTQSFVPNRKIAGHRDARSDRLVLRRPDVRSDSTWC